MVRKLTLLWAGVFLFSNAASVSAGVKEEAIIDKVIKAYGGEALTSATSMTITHYYKELWSGQSESPRHLDFWRMRSILTIDFKGKRKSMLSWRSSRTGADLDRLVFDGEKGIRYDLLHDKYGEEDWLNYNTIGVSVVRSSDTMIARTLAAAKSTATYEGDAPYRGAIYEKLKVSLGAGPEYTVFIHKTSGLISKMTRSNPRLGEVVYVFSDHDRSDGVAFAKDMNLFVGGHPETISVKRHIEINPSLKGMFAKPPGFTKWGEVFDTSEMITRRLADHVYQAGKDRSFPVFFDAGDYFIAAGGEAGLKERFQAIKDRTGAEKPLKYMIITHHHAEHLTVLNEAAELGATFVTVSDHLPTIRENLASNLSDERFVLVDGKASFAKGALDVYDIATAHSEHYLLVHFPESKLVFAEDHYETDLQTNMPRVFRDMAYFLEVVEGLGIAVEKYIDGHGPRILTSAEFKTATDAYHEVICPEGYDICR